MDTRANGAIQVVGEPSDTAPDGTIEIHLVAGDATAAFKRGAPVVPCLDGVGVEPDGVEAIRAPPYVSFEIGLLQRAGAAERPPQQRSRAPSEHIGAVERETLTTQPPAPGARSPRAVNRLRDLGVCAPRRQSRPPPATASYRLSNRRLACFRLS